MNFFVSLWLARVDFSGGPWSPLGWTLTFEVGDPEITEMTVTEVFQTATEVFLVGVTVGYM